MSDRLDKNMKIIALTTLIFLAGCSVFPHTTTVSATTKATTDAVPTVKASQTFKWSKKP